MKKKKTKIIIIIIIALIVIGAGVGGFFLLRKDKDTGVKTVKKEDSIKEFGYSINKTDSKIKKQKFKELKELLSQKEIDYEDYASKLAEIFAVDVYDLNIKANKYDVGGLEYVLDESKDSFKLKLQDTLYANIKDNTDNDRTQELPSVKDATKEEVTTGEFELNKIVYDSYKVKIKIDYEKDLGYDSNVYINMIKKEKKLYIVEVLPC